MSDLIKLDDTLKIICDTIALYGTGARVESEILSIVSKIPSAEPNWIPVTERLPEHHKEVLVTGVSAISGKKVYSVKVWDVDRWRPESAPSIRWDAWMPLPEAYRPEEGQE